MACKHKDVSGYDPINNMLSLGREMYRVLLGVLALFVIVSGPSLPLALGVISVIGAYGSSYLLELSKIHGHIHLSLLLDKAQVACVIGGIAGLILGVL